MACLHVPSMQTSEALKRAIALTLGTLVALATNVAGAMPPATGRPLASAPCTPGVLYGTDSVGLYTIDTATGAATSIGSHASFERMGALTFDRAGNLYAMSLGPSSQLFSVDPATGLATAIGPLDIGFIFEGGLSFDASGVLFGVDNGEAISAFTFTVDPSTGRATVIGSVATATRDLNGIVFDGTTLYALDWVSSSFGTIDTTTGDYTAIGPTLASPGVSGGLTMDPSSGVIYAYLDDRPGLYSIDKSSGAATFLGPNDVDFGIAFCPCAIDCLGCDVSSLIKSSSLLGVRLLDTARFSWSADAEAVEYHLNAVNVKASLTDPRLPPGNGEARCIPSPVHPTVSCVDPAAISDPRRILYYQLLSACGALAEHEGPF